MPNLLGAAIARFPFETGPLLQLLRGTLSAVTALGGFHLFTQAFPDGFRDYDLAQDEENNNFLVLTSAIPIFAQRGTRNQFLNGSANSLALESPHGNRTEDADMIPAGTQGRVVLEPSPFVVQWAHRFSCLRYLGRILESSLPSSEVVSVFAVDRNTLAEIIDLLAVLLTSSRRVSETGDDASNASAHGVLAETSEGIGRRNGDVIAVIFDLFENGIQDSLRPMAVDGTMDLLSSCTHFIFALTSILPGRVWPFFARSGLLEMNGLGGKFADIVASTEIIIGRFEFTIGCIHVFEALVDEAVVHAVARRATSKAVTRFSGVDRLGTGVPAQVMGRVLLAFERAILDVLASFSGWRYDVMDEKLEIGARILSIFEKIIIYTQGADDSANTDLKATAMLEPAAASLLDFFLSQGSSNAPINPLLRIFSDGMTSPHSTVFLGTSRLWTQQTVAALNFCTTLLRVGILRQRSGSRIGVQLFKLLPFFVRMYGAVEAYKQPVVSLLEAMVLTVASPEEEPPSILAHLGPATAKSFVGLLSRFSKPLEDENLDVAIWNLMSAAVSNRQQWFAIQLLTGKAPKESLRKSTEEPTVEPNGRKPVLVHALDRLTTLKELPPREAAAMAEFLALAGDYWPWSIAEAKRRPNLLRCFADYLGGLDVQIPPTNAAKAKEICNTLQMASLILEFLAIYIHHNAQEGDTSFAKELLPKLGYLKENAVTVRGYNHSLHTNLKKNFEARFPGCSLSFFKRTQLRKAEFGGNYLYDIELAQRMLEYDSSWLGGKGSSGLAGEFERANLNMSVVEAQVLLFYSWRVLLLELSAVIPTETALQEVMVRVVHGGLRSSQRPDLPEFVSARLAPVRMDLVFVLMQKLAEVRSTVPEMKTVLFTAWTAIKRSDVAFELAVSGGDVTYYRPLLRILLLSLQAHADGNAAPPSRGANSVGPSDGSANGGSARLPSSAASELQLTILDVLDVVVIRGFRSLAIRIHDRAGDSSPEDMALVTAILQTALDVQRLTDGTGYHAQQISNRFAEQGTARVASTLFSWSDRLAPAGSDGDPIYGELAMLFLLALSSLPWMAEHLAVDGVLTQISNGSATDPLRRPGALRQPITDPRALRLYSIWQRALLPLCLNLLRAVGAGIAPDVAHFLNQFAPQLRQASSHSFDTKPLASLATSTSAPRTRSALVAPIITAGMTSEAHSLALLHRILHGFRAAGSAAGLLPADIPPLQDWDGPALRDDVEYWLANRDLLRDRLWPVGPAEEDMARAKPTDGCAGAESAFEQRVVADLRAVVALLS
ncbi:MAG: hypothetical protein M1826_004273 [Phylliscum demangeonii]|nr:MAG: hypothetical protein M1826_004273 [Phylliscum demangeonii]